MFKAINNDTGSLKAGVNGEGFKVGDEIKINGENKVRKISYIMGKGEKCHFCMKGTGPVPVGDVEWCRAGETAPTVATTVPETVEFVG